MTTATRNGAAPGAIRFVTGQVEGVNDSGIKVDGFWFNYSKYPGKTLADLPMHSEGDVVDLKVKDKWIEQLSRREASSARSQREVRVPVEEEAEEEPRPRRSARRVLAAPADPDDAGMNFEVRRLAILSAAATAYQPTDEHPDDVAVSVLRIAELMESWVLGR